MIPYRLFQCMIQDIPHHGTLPMTQTVIPFKIMNEIQALIIIQCFSCLPFGTPSILAHF